jgi:hypothetical protein
MGLFDKLFGKKRCALCKLEIIDPEKHPDYKAAKARGVALIAAQTGNTRYLAWYMQEAYAICNNCGATICRHHLPTSPNPIPWKKFPRCPKCNSDMEIRRI